MENTEKTTIGTDINTDKYKNIKRHLEREMINLNPIQRGGILPTESKKVIYEYWDGYSVCDYCAGRLDQVETPPIHEYLEDASKFFGADITRPTHGARESKYVIMNSVCKPGDYVIMDGNAHYTSFVAAERAKLNIDIALVEDYPTYRVIPEKYKERIETLEDEGKPIGLLLLTHVDGNYGNVADAKKVGKIAKDKGYPFLLNCAYSAGRMPVNAEALNADFLAISGHKSMSGSGPCGLLAISNKNEEYSKQILKTSKKNIVKELEMLGCTSRGIPILTLMTSFAHVIERVNNWDKEVKRVRWIIDELEAVGFKHIGEKPKNHDLTKFETPILDEIAEHDKRKGYFFYEELKKRGIGGIRRGATKEFKMSAFGLTDEQTKYVVDSFKEIIENGRKENNLN
ncbi:O-phospho-L-seryl-tRNA:Cys-tRNA synthase [Methanococcus voltae]|uniref:O-phospho-L-seryl-tRNA:Cys-tRNA synthase n=1 Tax=Methanococcus voltae (strain ATCC BAA-1334 / A3) TaxID=456320 RepID=D7DT50_METV3|nr:O-phospho-L-seryl-tRNA:Cys-tRNA synthase [Methanococcus voltae]MCS3901834.1 Sep-tRNA:Cys-tRNA synthetase [Methanococcus voltae]